MDNCIFCRISKGEIPSSVVYENETTFAFRDINPQAPTHILVVPKKHISSLATVQQEDAAILSDCLLAVRTISEQEKLENGFRVISNAGPDACQSVHHLHFHILGGKKLTEKMD